MSRIALTAAAVLLATNALAWGPYNNATQYAADQRRQDLNRRMEEQRWQQQQQNQRWQQQYDDFNRQSQQDFRDNRQRFENWMRD